MDRPASPAPTRNASGRRREREIAEAATRIFRERGYADTSVEDIAEAVGILKGSLYHYMDSKEDLLFRILEEVHDAADQLLARARAREDLEPLDRLLEYVHDQVIYNAQNVDKIAVYYHDLKQLGPERRELMLARRRRRERYIKTVIKDAQQRGQIMPELPVELVSWQVNASTGWLYTRYRPGGAVTAEQLARFMTGFLRRALAPPGA